MNETVLYQLVLYLRPILAQYALISYHAEGFIRELLLINDSPNSYLNLDLDASAVGSYNQIVTQQ